MKILTVLSVVLLAFVSQATAQEPCSDINGDGQVNIADFLIFTEQYGQQTDCAVSKPPIVMVKQTGFLYSNINAAGYTNEGRLITRATILVDIELTKIRKLIDEGYSIIDFYVIANEGRQVNHYRPTEYIINVRYPDIPVWFHVEGNGSGLLWDIEDKIKQGQTTFGPHPYTLNFVMLHSRNIITDNTTN